VADLIFSRPRHAGGPVNLVFGAGPVVVVPDPVTVSGTSVLGGVSGFGLVQYDNRNPRRASTVARAPHQVAARALGQLGTGWGLSARELGAISMLWQPAARAQRETGSAWAISGRVRTEALAPWQLGRAVGVQSALVHQAARFVGQQAAGVWQTAQGRAVQAALVHQAALSLVAQAAAPWGTAAGLQALAVGRHGSGTARAVHFVAVWETGQPVPPGLELWPKPTPDGPPLRVPSTHLVFACPPGWLGSGPVNLLFGRVCTTTDPEYPPGVVVVPIRSVYMTINSFSLIRLDTGFNIPATALSLSLDVDSWTWNCSFSVRGDALPFVEPNSNGDPVIAQATVNGTPIRVLIEKIGRERTFGSSQLRCSGRGISAALDAPYAPVQSFANAGARTARQLLDDILTVNGQPIGWGIDRFDPTDWLVPAGVFSHTGTYMSALNAVAGSVGAYIQPKGTTDVLDVLLRYPTPAWAWSTATPDLVLPSAVTSREGIEWVDKPVYNRVFVSGQEGGVAGRYTRTGTAGDLLAPAVVEPLITHSDAVRQRGRAIISDTGRIANVTLRLPVLSETGIIKPGTMVRYTDGPVERIGLSRSVALDVAMPTIYQTIEVETHVE